MTASLMFTFLVLCADYSHEELSKLCVQHMKKINMLEVYYEKNVRIEKLKNSANQEWVAVAQRCSVKKIFLKTSQNSQENTCARVSFFIKFQASACNFIKKETLVQVFFCEFCEIFKNTFFIKHLRWLLLKGSGIERYKVKYINHSECKECPWGMVEFPMLFCFLKQQIKF